MMQHLTEGALSLSPEEDVKFLVMFTRLLDVLWYMEIKVMNITHLVFYLPQILIDTGRNAGFKVHIS